MNILVVDDHPFIHEFLGGVLRGVFGEVTLRFAGSLADALDKAAAGPAPDMATLDLVLPDCAGVETLLQFRKAQPEARVVVFSALEEHAHVMGALEAGAAGYLHTHQARR